jgi:FtsH-binding integral membrane protein
MKIENDYQGEYNLLEQGDENRQSKFVWEINNKIKASFIAKVYGIISFQLFITAIMCGISMYSETYLAFQLKNVWIFVISIILTICIVITISCYPEITRAVPLNYIILILFTVFESYSVSIICGIVEPDLVFMAVFLTFGLVIALTLYAAFCKDEFTDEKAIYATLIYALIFFFILLLFSWFTLAQLIVAELMLLLYGIIFVIDTQKVLGKHYRHNFDITIDDYIPAAMIIYSDIIIIFLRVLRVLRFSKNK